MIQIEHVDLGSYGVEFPSDQVGMVLAQPFLHLSSHEPYRSEPTSKEQQLSALSATFDIALSKQHGADKTHFTVFPEYSIPGISGVQVIDDALGRDNWPSGTVVLGGTDGLTKSEYEELIRSPRTRVNLATNDCCNLAETEWVNCGIVWVKAADGSVNKWLQPKLYPAWEEQDISDQEMFCGKSIFAFHGRFSDGTTYRFALLICFDWIATISGKRAWQWLLEELSVNAQTLGADVPFSWLFIPQHNPRPSHHTFLSSIVDFFNQTYLPSVVRERSCLVFANTAGKASPGRVKHHGGTSLVLSRQTLFTDATSPRTFSNGGARLRSSTLLQAFRDILFREGGACIHSFALVNPRSLVAGASGRRIAVKHAFVFPLYGINDPRAPSGGVSASIKWLNDELDELPSLASVYPSVALSTSAQAMHANATNHLRQLPSNQAASCVIMATSKSSKAHPDEWDDNQTNALKHLVHTVSILGVAYQLSITGSYPAHATLFRAGTPTDLVAVLGDTHEECFQHSSKGLSKPRRSTILVSRDTDNTKWNRRFGKFLDTSSKDITAERKITEPFGGIVQISYNDLLDAFRSASNQTDLTRATDDSFTT